MLLASIDGLSVRLANPIWPGVWDKIKPYLNKAIEETCADDWSIDDVFTATMRGQYLMWGIFVDEKLIGAMLSEETIFPKRKVVTLLLVGLDEHTDNLWQKLFATLCEVYKANGVSAIRGGGRRGWFRKLSGYKLTPKYAFEIALWE